MKDQMNKYGRGFIFGGTFALVLLCIFISIVRAASLNYAVFVGFGGASVIEILMSNSLAVCVVSCGSFIAVSDYVSHRSDRELIAWERKRESWYVSH